MPISEITETSPMQKQMNKSLAVAYINRTGNYDHDVEKSWCFYDEDKDFSNLMLNGDFKITERVLEVVTEKSQGRIKYYSKGIV